MIVDSTGLNPPFGRPSFKKNKIMWEFFLNEVQLKGQGKFGSEGMSKVEKIPT